MTTPEPYEIDLGHASHYRLGHVAGLGYTVQCDGNHGNDVPPAGLVTNVRDALEFIEQHHDVYHSAWLTRTTAQLADRVRTAGGAPAPFGTAPRLVQDDNGQRWENVPAPGSRTLPALLPPGTLPVVPAAPAAPFSPPPAAPLSAFCEICGKRRQPSGECHRDNIVGYAGKIPSIGNSTPRYCGTCGFPLVWGKPCHGIPRCLRCLQTLERCDEWGCRGHEGRPRHWRTEAGGDAAPWLRTAPAATDATVTLPAVRP